jgi:hypothetical protein
MKPILPRRWPTAVFAVLLVTAGLHLGSFEVVAGEKSSLTDSDIEATEAKVALESSRRENAALRQQAALAQQQVAALTESLAIANSESEVFKRETGDLKLRLEALGLDAAAPDKALLEQRLLKAVSDLKIVQDQKDKLSEQLIRLNEAVIRYVKNASSVDGDARMALETELRSSTEILGVTGAPGAVAQQPAASGTNSDSSEGSLTEARVLSVKEELGPLLVANIGRPQGVKMGMPFQVWQDGRKIGIARVVDVREQITGMVVQSQDQSEKIKVGDILRVDARM